MFLKKLELQGFKSFASKITIDFPEGITAIVGPNGSGKSNITDAIRWILGEREAKNLRGAKANDLIFAGTEQRARSGFAQASMYFDNSSGFFPTDYNEVVITRRIDRDGDSKFLLNGSEMRLKDLIDFFARSKLGARGLNIISQGESDSFLRASPSGRRVLIEEILGLKEFLLKKHSAERELRNTKINLDKARAMLEEIKPHLRMLRRQAGKYSERDNIAEELSKLENAYYGSQAKIISKDLGGFAPKISALKQEISDKKKELKGLEESLKKIDSSEPEAKKKLAEIREKRRELFNERMAFTPKSAPAPMSVEENSAQTDPLTLIKEIKDLALSAMKSTSIESLKKILADIISLISNIEEKKEVALKQSFSKEDNSADREIADKMAEFNKALDDLDIAERKLTLEMDKFNSSFRNALKAVESKKSEIDAVEDNLERILFEEEKIKYKKEELDKRLSAMGRSFSEFVSAPDSEVKIDSASAEKRIYRLRNELSAIGEIDESIIKEAEEVEERFSSTSEQVDELEKASIDLKELIKELDHKIHHEFSGALNKINKELSSFSKMMFGGGKVFLKLEEPVLTEGSVADDVKAAETGEETNSGVFGDEEIRAGIEIEVALPKKRIKGLEVLSGGERSLLSAAILFGLISISPPPFIVLDEVDAALDERNARVFGEMLDKFEDKSQFVVVTHNRATMESADALYGVTMGKDGSSKIVSLKLS
ncbi:MAG: AAA family ATPase [Candidatus Colwellbacteria bacterium]|jgi:chromosome segregation protein|nr:AAA family ATPase [Candidatus Colwellbacteria bacterium]MCK9497500.1 AAA family ATPase [Candidatus Colwellbacteria bacterium]MDD3752428.1 AAA family ATPase [Candidatus Colwellbacteria bacterium]